MSLPQRLAPWLFLLAIAAGCTEGQKANPLRRATPNAASTQPNKPLTPVPDAPLATPTTLYDRLGGDKGVTALVDEFVKNVAADEKIAEDHRAPFREGDLAGLKKHFVAQIAAAAGGPPLPAGKEMSDVRRVVNLPGTEFEALLGDLRRALSASNVSAMDRDQVLAVLERIRAEVVGQP